MRNLLLLGLPLCSRLCLVKLLFTMFDIFSLIMSIVQFEKFTHQMRDGWGLATDGEVLFGTDGSSTLYKLNPETLKGLSNM